MRVVFIHGSAASGKHTIGSLLSTQLRAKVWLAAFSEASGGKVCFVELQAARKTVLRRLSNSGLISSQHRKPGASSSAAYKLYMDHTLPFLTKSGGEALFYGSGGKYLIGPSDQRWDAAMLVRMCRIALLHPSLDALR